MEENTERLREIPPLSEILGLVEGQMVIYKSGGSYHSDTDKYVISELYDNYLRIRKPSGTTSYTYRDIDMKKVEAMMTDGTFVPLTKNKKPAMGKRSGIFNKEWYVK